MNEKGTVYDAGEDSISFDSSVQGGLKVTGVGPGPEPSSKPNEPIEESESFDFNPTVSKPGSEGEPKGEPSAKADKLQSRINTITYHRRAAERKASEETAKRIAAEKKLAELEKPTGPAKEPVESDYGNYTDFMKDWNAWSNKQNAPGPGPGAEEPTGENEQASLEYQDKLHDMLEDGSGKWKDFRSTVKDVDVTDVMNVTLLDSDYPAEIAYYLGKNPEKALEIGDLPVHRQAAEIGKIETLVRKSLKGNRTDVKLTDEIVTPVNTGATNPKGKHPNDMTDEEYRAYRGRDKHGFKVKK